MVPKKYVWQILSFKNDRFGFRGFLKVRLKRDQFKHYPKLESFRDF